MQRTVECPRGCGLAAAPGPVARHAALCWTPRTIDRLMQIGSVDTADPSACWPWKGGDLDERYPRLAGVKVSRRILAAQLNREPLRTELACHTCDRKGCVNPSHIYSGTDKTNYADMVRNGRVRTQAGELISQRMKRQWSSGKMEAVRGDRVERAVLSCEYCGDEVKRLQSQCRKRTYCSREHFYAHRKTWSR